MRVKICNETTDVIRQNGKIFLEKMKKMCSIICLFTN